MRNAVGQQLKLHSISFCCLLTTTISKTGCTSSRDMNKSEDAEASGTTTSVLLQKLTNHFAKDDRNLASKLFSFSIKCFTLTPHKCETDEEHSANNIRRTLKIESPADLKTFEVLYMNIKRNSSIKHLGHILTFLLDLSRYSMNEKDPWSVMQDLPNTGQSDSRRRSQVQFLPDDVNSGVKKLYQSRPVPSSMSQRNTVPSVTGLSNCSEQDLFKDRSASTISSSRSTFVANVSECQLIQDIIYSFQGIEGRVVRKELGGLGFTVDPKYGKHMTPIHRGLIERLVGLGFLHNQLKQHCDEADKQIGLIGQSLIAIFREELTDYYHMVALLQAQSKKQGCADHSELTLRRMVVWVAEAQLHLQWLAHIAEACADKKGGALISAVHGFLQHGSPGVQKVSEKVLSAVCRPLYLMLSRWLLNGDLYDPCGEFFIEARSINVAERLWHDKYHVRKTMIPSFITLDQANKILATGKSINFLRQICKDTAEVSGRENLQKLFTTTLAEALFTPEQSIELQSELESVYRETSLRVLDLLKNKYRLLEHLQALRRYLLLGQGDFIRHLLELLAPELSRPAHNLYGHTLTAILESAIRMTNAQFEDEDTLQRLNVCMLDSSRDDKGWDVFTLVYLVDGPVGTIFQPTVSIYKALFGGLWKVKRMEFVLSNMRKQQITSNKLYKNIREMRTVTHAIHVLASEMIHFLHQTQYYFLFEVLECSWAEMLKEVTHAGCLDDVIKAHSAFLSSVQCGVLLDTGSDKLRLQLALIFQQILNLESIQESLYSAASQAKDRYTAYKKLQSNVTDYGVNRKQEADYRQSVLQFHQFLATVKRQIQFLSKAFREYVVKYVTLLACSSDMNLQLLSTRLNFNDYYKIT